MARRWIKLWVAESLRGTSRFDFTPAERGVWYDLLILAGDCRQDGLISPGAGVSYPLRWIAVTLNIGPSLLHKTIEKCKKCSRIEENVDGFRILNWNKYQSDYERQKPYRAKKVTTKVHQKLPLEEEEEKEVEIDKEVTVTFKEFYDKDGVVFEESGARIQALTERYKRGNFSRTNKRRFEDFLDKQGWLAEFKDIVEAQDER